MSVSLVEHHTGQAAGVLLDCNDLAVRQAGRIVFSGARWLIKTGERWAIVGPNGAGKSLLGSILAGKTPLVRGELVWGNDTLGSTDQAKSLRPSTHLPAFLVSPQWHREILAQESTFYQSRWHSSFGEGELTVARFLSQEVVEGINPYEIDPQLSPRQNYNQAKREFVGWLGAGPLWRRKLLCLSHGEMRKVLLVHALLHFPRLLVLDDPFGGLDADTRVRLRQVIRRLGGQALIITNRLDEIPAETTHLSLVNNYRVVAQGEKAKVLGHPLMERVRAQSRPQASHPGSSGSPLPTAGLAVQRLARPAVLVDLRGVTIRYGRKPILQDIDWTIRADEHWALLGPNGAGKSTLLSVIQVDNPQAYAQNLLLFGASRQADHTLWRARQHIGWMSSELHLHYPLEVSAQDVVCSGFANSIGLYHACSARQRQEARRWLQRLQLETFRRALFGDLSLAEQRIVLLARAVVKRPWLLILDEPCQGLDATHRRRIIGAVEKLVAHSNASLIYVTHYPEEMPHCITHVLRLRSGRAMFRGALDQDLG